MGLANLSLPYYLKAAEEFGKKKPVILSLAGLSLEENLSMFQTISDSEKHHFVSGIELNLSCPNVPGKPQTAYDFEAMAETLNRVFEVHNDHCPLGVKLPPYFDPIHFAEAADVLKSYPKLRWVTCINSIGNGLFIDPINEETVIAPKGGLGGIGGTIVKPTALANVRTFRNLLPETIDIIGCGGISKGMDIFEHILCGATAVQVGTYLQENGVRGISKLFNELQDVMRLKNDRCLADFRNRLSIMPGHPNIFGNKDPSC